MVFRHILKTNASSSKEHIPTLTEIFSVFSTPSPAVGSVFPFPRIPVSLSCPPRLLPQYLHKLHPPSKRARSGGGGHLFHILSTYFYRSGQCLSSILKADSEPFSHCLSAAVQRLQHSLKCCQCVFVANWSCLSCGPRPSPGQASGICIFRVVPMHKHEAAD